MAKKTFVSGRGRWAEAQKNHTNGAPARPRPKPADALPPHSEEAERGVLGCILLAADSTISLGIGARWLELSQAEVDGMLAQIKPRHFYVLKWRAVIEAMTRIRMEGHVLNSFTLAQWLKDHAAGDAPAATMAEVSALADDPPSAWSFGGYLAALLDKAHRRWLLAKGEELSALAGAEEVSLDTTRERLSELWEATTKATGSGPLIEFVTPKEAKAFVPDPADFLIGDGLIQREAFHTFGGEPGSGKSRMLTTLAVAGAQGRGLWLGYPVRRAFRTLILQTENTGNRLKEELGAVPDDCAEGFRVARSMPHGMAFGDGDFRRFIRKQFEREPFDVLGIDPWNDVVSEEGQSDYAEALVNIRRCFTGVKCPAVIIVAHLRKMRSDASGRRKTGRELLHEISGSLKLGSTSRTVFAVQPVSPSMDDDRIVIELAKANDVSPEFFSRWGRRAAWHRRNAIFEPCQDFDWDRWENPSSENEERRAVTLAMVRECMGKRQGMRAAELVKLIAEKFDKGESTVWRAIREGSGYLSEHLTHAAGVVALAGRER